MDSKPEIVTQVVTTLDTPSSPKRTSKEFEDAILKDSLNTNAGSVKNDCPQKIQHRLSLRLSNSPGSSPQNVISPRSPNRSNSPLVNKLYEEELLCDNLIMTTQVNEDLIEAVNKINSASSLSNKQMYSPNKSPEPRKS